MKLILNLLSLIVISNMTMANPTQLDEIFITASKGLTPPKHLAGSYEVITAQQIRQSGAKSVMEVLRQSTGLLKSINSSSIDGRKTVSIRGLDSKYTLILIDGIRINNTDGQIGHSNFSSNWIPLESIEKIEIVRGPISSLYGSDAMGGVINIITKKQRGMGWGLEMVS